MSKFINPLDKIDSQDTNLNSNSSDSLSSESTIINNEHGVCPKCKDAMPIVKALDENVYHCKKCRVTNPIPVGS